MAAVAVSGEAAERPMEPEAVRASLGVFAVYSVGSSKLPSLQASKRPSFQ